MLKKSSIIFQNIYQELYHLHWLKNHHKEKQASWVRVVHLYYETTVQQSTVFHTYIPHNKPTKLKR